MASVAGLVLAAGGGTRLGIPKAIVRAGDGSMWLTRATSLLEAAGCAPVLVTLGAARQEAAALVPADVSVVPVPRWRNGQSESLRAGLQALASSALDISAVLVTLVDLPELPVEAAVRVLSDTAPPSVLRRAWYGGHPGHPVLIGRHHWGPVAGAVDGDAGARTYLSSHGAVPVECTDLHGGDDVDDLAQLAASWRTGRTPVVDRRATWSRPPSP